MGRKITVYDEAGRPQQVDAESWADEVLPVLLDEAWDDPESLATRILSAIEDGFAERVLEAAEQLVEIDPEAERATSVLALAHSRCDEIDEAEGLLLRFLADHGDSALVLAQLGELEAERGEAPQGERLFRRALAVDPNCVLALERIVAIQLERGGPKARETCLADLCGAPGSYWPQLLRARDRLLDGDILAAEELYDSVWSLIDQDIAALVRVSGDLGECGFPDRLIDRIKPIWQPERHGPILGLNLARACLERHALAEGRAILRDLIALDVPHLIDEVRRLEAEFVSAQLAGVQEASSDLGTEPLQVAVVPFEGPVWASCFSDPGPLVVEPVRASQRVALLAFADVRAQQLGKPVDENDVVVAGRMSRGVPLYLGESLSQTTDAHAATLIPVVHGQGPILAGEPWDPEWFLSEIPVAQRPAVLVSGTISVAGLELRIYDVHAGTTVSSASFGFDPAALGDVPLSLIEATVRDALERGGYVRPRSAPSPFYAPMVPECQSTWLTAIDHLHAQVLVAGRLVERDALVDEQSAMQNYFDLADAMPDSANAVLLACGGVLAAHGYGSGLAEKFKEPVLRLLRAGDPGGVFARLADHVEERL